MTTLPQTANVRMTRPVGVGTSALSSVGGAHGAAAAALHLQQANTMSAGDVWRVLRANGWFIAAMLVISTVIGYGAYWGLNKYYARYTAVGWVEITVSRPSDPLVAKSDQYYDTNLLGMQLRKQAQLLHTDALLSKVLRDGPNIRSTSWFRQFIGKDGKPDIAAAKDDLGDKLTVAPVLESPLIMVAMSWRDAKDCRLIVEDLVNLHLSDQRALKTDKDTARSQDLNGLKNQLTYKLDQTQKDIYQLQVDLAKEGVTSTRGISPRDLELQELMKSQSEAQSSLNEAKAAMEGIKGKIAAGENPTMVEQAVNMDQRVMMARSTVDQHDLYLAQQKSLGTESPRYKQALDARNAAQQKLDDILAETRNFYTTQLSEKFEGAVNGFTATLQALTERVNTLKDALGELDYKQVQYLSKVEEANATRDSLKLVNDQIQTIAQMKNQADVAGITWSQRPETPELPSFPKLGYVMAAAISLGLVLALGWAFTRELLDTSVRSPRDIQRVGQLTLLGMIPHEDDDPQSHGVPLPMVIYQAPTSMLAEQFRQVRTRLQHAASLDTTRSILVTSPSPSDGKSTVAANLASGLALNGRRILLVDANFRRPELHKIFAVNNDTGFASVLADVNELGNAVHHTNVPNLDVLPAGPKPGNATELLESQLLVDFIDKALEEYDHVIFDTGPILFVSETVALAPRVDGVVTVVRARSNSRGLLQRMRDQLRQLKAEHLGVVLNAVRAQGGGYYARNIKTHYEYQNGHAG